MAKNADKVVARAEEVLDSFTMGILEDKYETTGSIALDMVLSNGKGYPIGKTIEIAGPSSCGKSTLCLFMAKVFCARGERVLYIDLEGGVSDAQVDAFGLDEYVKDGRFRVVNNVRTFGDCCEVLDAVLLGTRLQSGGIAVGSEVKSAIYEHIFLDSLKGLIPDNLLTGSGVSMAIGSDARYIDLFLRKYKRSFEAVGSTFWIVNQFRTSLANFKASQQSSGGQALEYFSDIRVQMWKKAYIVGRVNTPSGVTEIKRGHYAILVCKEKNRHTYPGIEVSIAVLYGKGISNVYFYRDKLAELGYIRNAGAYKKIKLTEDEVTLQGDGNVFKYIMGNLELVKEVLDRHHAFELLHIVEED